MKIINVNLKVKPGMQSEYEQFIKDLVEGSLAEAGNVYYGHFRKVDSFDEYEIIEQWQDQAAVDFHNETPHFQKFLAHIGDYLVKDPQIFRMDYEG
ncbi:MAG: antibiotic biosynthesis monooxygenase [Lactobacillus sp.]|jgi:quinol monooxygenase YgiN|nr:antibiotic biosynthesis monooxygenase [Lactobacillus sp.]